MKTTPCPAPLRPSSALSLARLAALCAFALCASVPAAELVEQPPQRLPAGTRAPLAAFLAEHRNQPLLVNFWASWYEPCRDEMPALQRLDQRWRARGLMVVTVAVADSPARSEAFLKALPGKLPLVQDPEQSIARAWDVPMLPLTVVLDRLHRVVARGRGAIDWDSALVEQQLLALLR